MELNKQVDSNYHKDKEAFKKLEKLQEIFKKTKEELKQVNRNIEDTKTCIDRAKEDKDKSTLQAKQQELKALEEKRKQIIERGKKQQSILKNGQNKINAYMEEIEKDPELKSHLNSIMEKHYNKKLKLLEKDKKQLKTLRKIISQHPTLENNLKGMFSAKEKIEKLKEELKDLQKDPIKNKARIEEINNKEIPIVAVKKVTNRTNLINYLQKNNIDISEKFIDDLVNENGFKHDDKGNVNLDKTLNNISKGYDKRIRTYEKAIEKIPGGKIHREKSEYSQEEKEGIGKRISNRVKQALGRGEASSEVEQEENYEIDDNENNLPAKVEKGFHPIKRFKNWLAKRKADKGTNKVKETSKKETVKESTSKFKDAYRYEVIQDYVKIKEEELYKESSKEVRKEVGKETRKEEKEEKEEYEL